MKRAVFVSLTILCLLSISSITGLIQVAKADGGTITINADGSISPSTAPIYTADNITYTLTGNITANADGILIERNNVVLNGAGYTVAGSPFIGNERALGLNGTTLTASSNVTVRNLIITNFATGIYLYSSSNSILYDNNVANSLNGIYLYSSGNTLSGNNITNNPAGIDLFYSSGNTLSGNNITNNDYGIFLYSCSNNTIYHNNFNNTNQIFSYDSTNVWDNGSVGNYWSDYLTKYPNATETDGVWNTPYVIDANKTDRYPLTHPYVIAASPTFPVLPLFVVVIVVAVIVLLAVMVYKKKGMKRSKVR